MIYSYYKKFSWGAILILIASMVLAIFLVTCSMRDNLEASRENQLRSATQLVDSAIAKTFMQPIVVAKTMSEDVYLKDSLKRAGTDPKGVESNLTRQLRTLREGMEYKIMFAVCDKSGAYYTYDGITTYVKQGDENSQWYYNFLNSGRNNELCVDIEASTDWGLSVFVNQLVRDDQNNILGVCGTGVEMNQLQSLLELYERVYQIKINMVNGDGLIQIDTDVNRIKNDSIQLPNTDFTDGQYYYEKRPEGDRIITYISSIDRYLIIENKQNLTDTLLSNMRVVFATVGVGLIVALGLMGFAELKRN